MDENRIAEAFRRQAREDGEHLELLFNSKKLVLATLIEKLTIEKGWVHESVITAEAVRLRSLHESGIECLKDSMANAGYSPTSPLLVCPAHDGKLYVLDGRHRLAAVRRLIKEGLLDDVVPVQIISTAGLSKKALVAIAQGMCFLFPSRLKCWYQWQH